MADALVRLDQAFLKVAGALVSVDQLEMHQLQEFWRHGPVGLSAVRCGQGLHSRNDRHEVVHRRSQQFLVHRLRIDSGAADLYRLHVKRHADALIEAARRPPVGRVGQARIPPIELTEP